MPTPAKCLNEAMLLGRLAGLLSALVVVFALTVGEARASSGSRRTPVVDAIEKVHRSVVSISSEKKAASHSRWPFSPEENRLPRVNGMGSGVVIDGRGYILTNHHVVDRVQGIAVQLYDGTTYSATVLQFDPVLDIAVIKIDPVTPLTPVEIGTSSDLMVGETVVTIGNAFGYENTVSVGIISALHRDVTLSDDQVYRNLIQTDACINPGNSGGPLINIDGELIGINVAVRAGAQGIGFALPIDDVKRVAADLLSTRRLVSTWHGIVATDQKRGAHRGVLIADVQAGSPAEAAGLKPGDELIKVGDLRVTQRPRCRAGNDRRSARPSRQRDRSSRHRRDHSRLGRQDAARDGRRHDGRPRRPGLEVTGNEDVARLQRIRCGGVSQTSRWVVRAVGAARRSCSPGLDPTRRYPGWNECRQPALGDNPAGQHSLRSSPARNGPGAKCSLLRRASQRDPTAPCFAG